jgi:hypothetical protein
LVGARLRFFSLALVGMVAGLPIRRRGGSVPVKLPTDTGSLAGKVALSPSSTRSSRVLPVPIRFRPWETREHREQYLRLRDLLRIIAVELAGHQLFTQPRRFFRRCACHVLHDQLGNPWPRASVAP